MAGQSRTLKLSILADVDQLKKSLAQANGDVDNSSSKMGEFSKKAGLAFAAVGAAAGAYAVKLAVDGVKAAIEDEAAQIRLATALKNATGATNQMIASVEQQILKTSLATGVADDKLRPALQRLALSTNDVTKAQDLLNLALDISQATGKGLDSVANALGKAYDGNTAALGKLGIGLSTAELKAMSFTDVQSKLTDLFGGAAAANAETFAGRLEILKVTFDEAKESVGARLLPIIQQLVEFVINEVVPALGKFADFFKPITKAVEDNKETFADLISFIQKYVIPVLVTGLGGALKVIAAIIAGLVNGFANLLSGIQKVINAVKLFIKLMTDNPITRFFGGGDNSKGLKAGGSGGGGGGFDTGMGTGEITGIISPATGADIGVYSKSMQAAIIRREELKAETERLRNKRESDAAARLAANGGLSTGERINVTVNGAIDAEGTARTIVNVLNDSFFRGTAGAGALQGI
jgi:phage-related protein